MPQEQDYTSEIYNYLGTLDKTYQKEVSLDKFKESMKDKNYASDIHSWIGSKDKTFTKDVPFDDFYGSVNPKPAVPSFSTDMSNTNTLPVIKNSPLQANVDKPVKVATPTYIDPTKVLKTKDVVDINAEKAPKTMAQMDEEHNITMQNRKIATLTQRGLDESIEYQNLLVKKQAKELGYTDDKTLNGTTAVQKLANDREEGWKEDYLEPEELAQVRAFDDYQVFKEQGKEKESNEALQKYLKSRTDYRKGIDNDIVNLKGELASAEGDDAVLIKATIAELEAKKLPFYDPKKQMESFLTENETDVAAVSRPTETAQEKLKKYILTQDNLVHNLRNRLGLTDKNHSFQRFTDEWKVLSGDKRQRDDLEFLHNQELKLKNAVQILELNRTPLDKDSAWGVFAKEYVGGLIPQVKGFSGTDNTIAANIGNIVQDADITYAANEKQVQTAKFANNQYQFGSAKWIAQNLAPTLAVMTEMIPAAVLTEGIGSVGYLSRLSRPLKILAERGSLGKAGGTFFKVIQANKYGRGLLKAAASGVNYGIESQAVTTLAPQLKDEMGFSNGLFAGTVGSVAGQLAGKVMETSLKSIATLFGNKAPQAIAAIEKYGSVIAKAKEFSNTVAGETTEEYGEQLMSIYKESSNYKNFIYNLKKHYETTDALEEFATILMMSVGAPAGSTLGRSLFDASKKAYNNLNRKERETASRMAEEIHNEVNLAMDDAANQTIRDENIQVPTRNVEEQDSAILQKQKDLKLPTAPEVVLSDVSKAAMAKMESGEALTIEELKELSNELYQRYNGISATKDQDNRQFTTEQINETLAKLENNITLLENSKNKLEESGETSIVINLKEAVTQEAKPVTSAPNTKFYQGVDFKAQTGLPNGDYTEEQVKAARENKLKEAGVPPAEIEKTINAEQEIIPATETPAAPTSGVSGEVQESGNVEQLTKEQNDKENGTGVQSNIGEGKEPIKAKPNETTGGEKIEAGGNVQASEEEVAALENKIIVSGLSDGWTTSNKTRAGTTKDSIQYKEAFDPRNESGENSGESFIKIIEKNGKKYRVLGLRMSNPETVLNRQANRSGMSYATIEDNGNLPDNIDELLIKKAIQEGKNLYENIVKLEDSDFILPKEYKPKEAKQAKETTKPIAEQKAEAGSVGVGGEVELEKGNKIQWNVFGNEESGEWTVGETTKTRGGKDAVVLTKVYVEASSDGKSYTKEYADANGIKYDNERTVEHIVPLEDLQSLKETPKAETTKVTPKEGDTSVTKSARGMIQNMVFKDGEWQIKFGKDFTTVSSAVNQEAQDYFNENNAPVAEVKEQAPVVKEQAAPPVKAEEKPTKEQKEPVKEQKAPVIETPVIEVPKLEIPVVEQAPVTEPAIVEEEEQYEPITVSDTSHEKFTKDNAVDYEEGEREGDNGRSYSYLASVTVELIDDVSGDTIGTISKLKDEDGEITWNAENNDGDLVAEEYSSKSEAQQALVDNWNKQKLKEFNKEKAKAAKEKIKEAEKAKNKAQKIADKEQKALEKIKEKEARRKKLEDLARESGLDISEDGESPVFSVELNENLAEDLQDEVKTIVEEAISNPEFATSETVNVESELPEGIPMQQIVIDENDTRPEAQMMAQLSIPLEFIFGKSVGVGMSDTLTTGERTVPVMDTKTGEIADKKVREEGGIGYPFKSLMDLINGTLEVGKKAMGWAGVALGASSAMVNAAGKASKITGKELKAHYFKSLELTAEQKKRIEDAIPDKKEYGIVIIYKMGADGIKSNEAYAREAFRLIDVTLSAAEKEDFFKKVKERLAKIAWEDKDIYLDSIKAAKSFLELENILHGENSKMPLLVKTDIINKGILSSDKTESKEDKNPVGFLLKSKGITVESVAANIAEPVMEGITTGQPMLAIAIDPDSTPFEDITRNRHKNYPFGVEGFPIGLFQSTASFHNLAPDMMDVFIKSATTQIQEVKNKKGAKASLEFEKTGKKKDKIITVYEKVKTKEGIVKVAIKDKDGNIIKAKTEEEIWVKLKELGYTPRISISQNIQGNFIAEEGSGTEKTLILDSKGKAITAKTVELLYAKLKKAGVKLDKEFQATRYSQKINGGTFITLLKKAQQALTEIYKNPKLTAQEKLVKHLSKAFPSIVVEMTLSEYNKLQEGFIEKKLFTKSGKSYGVVKDGRVYLNPTYLNNNTPIHEFGHIWNAVAREARPELYKKGADLVKDTKYTQNIINSPSYQKIIKQLFGDKAIVKNRTTGKFEINTKPENLKNFDKINDYVIDEALARAIGDKGELFVNEVQKRKSFQDWMNLLFDVVKQIAGFPTIGSQEFQDLTIDQFINAAVKELLGGKQISDITSDNLANLSKESAYAKFSVTDKEKEFRKNALAQGYTNKEIDAILKKAKKPSVAPESKPTENESPTVTTEQAEFVPNAKDIKAFEKILGTTSGAIRNKNIAEAVKVNPKIQEIMDNFEELKKQLMASVELTEDCSW